MHTGRNNIDLLILFHYHYNILKLVPYIFLPSRIIPLDLEVQFKTKFSQNLKIK
jgi:hypothetical protein